MAGVGPGSLTAGRTPAAAFCRLKKSERGKLSLADAVGISVIRSL